MSILDGSTSYDPTAMPNQIGGASATIDSSSKDVKESKPSAKKVARDLLASFAPAAPVVESAAEKERKRRIERLTSLVRGLAQSFDDLNAIDGDPVAAAAGLKALNTVLTQGTKAIQAITDARLAPEPKTPRASRTPKPASEVSIPMASAEVPAPVENVQQPSADFSAADGNTGF